MIIKVCGMREAENIREVEALGIDMMGFIFWPKSSRYVSERPAYLPTQCKRVGVFVNEDAETIKRIAEDYDLDYIQLHGSESPE
ncbi:MAG: phosphoribosylanthranilate isomerase, partial [Bacteroidaceae bacterium]|nr:phosphoribosylanthranilate isomerase [Bacteroidaceae bacterium]